ncbi:hypothetical protein [Magnetospirillum sp. UT-4]|uniref:hypothetical protein n=1 Tax=Magnetospirillum sp. UT-4 TaxID=2681467 RepID=UPI0013825D5D|nr:hypothetical protein [Magnetospirillum sp. UT-4]CAA7621253.1 conserved hypothetical protein [Magnetospirillum sp. UT-4]
MTAKELFVIGSVVYNVGGVIAIATLGAISKVPSAEYWPVVLGAAVVGIGWLGLLAFMHFSSLKEL